MAMIKIVDINRDTENVEFPLFMKGVFGAERDFLKQQVERLTKSHSSVRIVFTMAVELEKTTREILGRLSKNDPDRKFIAGILDIAEGYNARPREIKEIPVEARKFSPEAREGLEKAGYVVYELTGQSIRSLREAGRRFWTTWHQDFPEFEALNSSRSQVAVNPSQLFLPDSNRKTLKEQEAMVARFSKKLAKEIPGVQAIIGEAPDYVEYYTAHLDATDKHLFGKEYGYGYARTKTPTSGSDVAFVGRAFPADGLGVHYWGRDGSHDGIFAAPLVVPV